MKLIIAILASCFLFGCAVDRKGIYIYEQQSSTDPMFTFGDRENQGLRKGYRASYSVKTNEANIDLCKNSKAVDGSIRFPSNKSIVIGGTSVHSYQADQYFRIESVNCSPPLLAFLPENNKHYSVSINYKQDKSCFFDVVEKVANNYVPVKLAIEKNICIY